MTKLLLVGCYTPSMGTGRGITLLEYRPGTFVDRGLVALTESPSFLIAQDGFVYVVNETQQGRVTSFRLESPAEADVTASERAVPRLHHVAVQNTGGSHPCHLAIDPSGQVLAAANYTSGSVSLHRLDGAGGIQPRSVLLELHGSGPVTDRQDAAHAHQIVFADGLMLVVDLGSDRVWRYRLDPAAVTVEAIEPLLLPAGFGPRQVIVAAEHTYVLGELSSDLAVFTDTQLVSVLPAYGGQLPAGNLAATLLRVAPDRLLVSHRGADRICVFQTDGDNVAFIEEFSSAGESPRHIAADDGLVFIANQLSDTVVARPGPGREQNGGPMDAGPLLSVATPNPTCVLPLI